MRPYSLILIALLAAPALADTGADTPRVIYLPCTSDMVPTVEELARGIWGTRQPPVSYADAVKGNVVPLVPDLPIWPMPSGSGSAVVVPNTPTPPVVPLSRPIWFLVSAIAALVALSMVFRGAK